MSPTEFLEVVLRRIRHEAGLALFEQRPQAGVDAAALRGLLDSAKAEELAARERSGVQPWLQIARQLALRPIDELLLAATIALERDPTFTLLVSGLHGGAPVDGVSSTLLAQILRLSGDEALQLRLDEQHPLVSARLIEMPIASHAHAETLRPYRASQRTVSFLDGSDRPDPLLDRCGSVVDVPDEIDLERAADSLDLMSRILESGDDVIVCLEGADGVGRRTIAAVAAARFGLSVFAVDAGRLSTRPERLGSELRALSRECSLRGALPIVARIDALARGTGGEERLDEVARTFDGARRRGRSEIVILTAAPGTTLPDFRRRLVRLRLDAPGALARQRIWARALGPSAALDDAELAELSQRHALNPGAIHNAAANARMLAGARPPSILDVRQGVTAEIQERFGSLATRIDVVQSWDDLVLPIDTLDDVTAFVSRAKHASMVYDKWGFRAKLQRGFGLAALFSGPPGTGKTMVAGLIARELELELYMIDLSQVVSKWVGETEKHLGQIFDAAAVGQALLLFDEADALFARRTEVNSSNDRYANLEVNYLLQKIEQFAGVAILTTNLETSVDPAFKRRLAADIHFYAPERDEREVLWRTVVPREAPLSPNVDFARLADLYTDMCGGHIRNAVLRAAFLAASDRQPISQQHLQRAARSEYRSMGKVQRETASALTDPD